MTPLLVIGSILIFLNPTPIVITLPLPTLIEERQYEEPLEMWQILTEEYVIIPNTFFCVRYLREVYGIDTQGKDADEFVPNSKPFEGALVIYRYEDVSHIGLLDKFGDDGFWEVGANLDEGKSYRRYQKWSDIGESGLVGFWTVELDKEL